MAFNLTPFVISRCCEILSLLTCTLILIIYIVRTHQEKQNGHTVALKIRLLTYGIMLIVIIQNLFNSLTSWMFVFMPSIKEQEYMDYATVCAIKEYTNFALTATFKLLLYQFFLLRMSLALSESSLRYPACVITTVRIFILLYCISFAYCGIAEAKIVTFESFNGGFDCYYEFEDVTLWTLGIWDTVLSFICSYLFIRKLYELHRLSKQYRADSTSKPSLLYDPKVSKSQSTLHYVSRDDDKVEMMKKDSMRKIKRSIHSALTAHDKYVYKSSVAHDRDHDRALRMAEKIQLLPKKITLLYLIQFVVTWLFYYLGYSTVLAFLGWFVPINGIIDVLCVYCCFRFSDAFFYGKCIPCMDRCFLCLIQSYCRFCCCCCCQCCYRIIALDGMTPIPTIQDAPLLYDIDSTHQQNSKETPDSSAV